MMNDAINDKGREREDEDRKKGKGTGGERRTRGEED